MKNSYKTGLGFGLTSGVITVLGIIVGLNSGTHSISVVIGGIITVAIADAFSDALGIHVSQEADIGKESREVWESTIITFFTKFIISLSFIVPILLFSLSTAVLVAIVWGLLVLTIFSYYLARQGRANPFKVIFEHVGIGILVIIITHLLGQRISNLIN
jgi:VIT1/CCC1 family predicted Fe2+/Mn2+ transporter